MKGNPFFTQQRPGKNEKIFKLIKFRSMTCETDENGNPLPDEVRLTQYGKLLRSTSLDELPELINILIGDMSIADNLVLKSTETDQFSRGKGMLLNKKAINTYAEEQVKKYDIRCTSIDQTVRSLSGGNQQKVILSREIESEPDLLVVVHPTRGLDIGATRFVHDQMIAARERGVGILLISADFDEVLEMSDRVLVIFEGQIMGEFSGKNPPIQEISLAMTGK